MRRFTRLTNAFSKDIQNHAAMVAIYTVQCNRQNPQDTANHSQHGFRIERPRLEP
jgi:hypothetical protein